MSDKRVSILGIRPVHPGRGEPSYIEANVALEYLKGTPIVGIRIEPAQAVELIRQLAVAHQVTTR